MAGRGGSDDLVRLVVIGGLGYFGYSFALKGALGSSMQTLAQQIHDSLNLGKKKGDKDKDKDSLPPGRYDADVIEWAKNIGLSNELGQRFKDSHAGKLPGTLAELEDWGNQNHYRRDDGTWTI